MLCSKEASKAGVQAGMNLSQARALCGELIWREYNKKLYSRYEVSLVKELIQTSPRVVAQEPGLFLLDAEGRKHLGGESKLCRDILRLSSRCGFVEGQVAIADTAFSALVATRFKSKRWFVVPTGSNEEFLAPLSISHLPIADELHTMLWDLGIKTMGQLAQIPEEQAIARFGKEGKLAHELARGIDLSQPCIPVYEREFEYRLELGGAIDSLSQTMFVMKSILDRLITDLRQNGLRADELTIRFFNDDELFDQRPIELINASNNAKFLLEVLRLSLESQPLMREYTGLAISVSRYSQELWEQQVVSKLENKSEEMSPESLSLLLQRLVIRCGEDVIVKPVANDHYGHEKSGSWQPVVRLQHCTKQLESPQTCLTETPSGSVSAFKSSILFPTGSSASSSVPPSSDSKAEPEGKVVQLRLDRNLSSPSDNQLLPHALSPHIWATSGQNDLAGNAQEEMDAIPVEVNAQYIKEMIDSPGVISHLVLRKHALPVPVMVELNETQLAAIRYYGRWHYVKMLTTPDCISGNWWSKPTRRAYYTALIDEVNTTLDDEESPILLLLFHDHDLKVWFVEGVFD